MFDREFTAGANLFLKYVCGIPKGLGMEHAPTQLAVKVLLDDSSGFDEMRWTIILPEKQK